MRNWARGVRKAAPRRKVLAPVWQPKQAEFFWSPYQFNCSPKTGSLACCYLTRSGVFGMRFTIRFGFPFCFVNSNASYNAPPAVLDS